MSASDNLSTKCSGLLLRSSFAILAARTRHLTSVDRMPAFSVASRLSNSSDILLRASSEPPPPWVACCAHQVQNFDLSQRFWCRGLGAMASTNKSLARVNKSLDVGKVTKKRSAQPVSAERIGPNRPLSSALLNLPRPVKRLGPFSLHGSDEQIFGADEQVVGWGQGSRSRLMRECSASTYRRRSSPAPTR
jgi:hypothetical protein